MIRQSLYFRRRLLFAALLVCLSAASAPSGHSQERSIPLPGPGAPQGAAGEAMAADAGPTGPYYHVIGNDDHLKMVVHSSRFLVLDKRIPQVQVNNPDILDVVPMSPTQVQISAKKTGVTQVNLWGEDKRIYTVTVLVMGDAAELAEILRAQFPRTTLTVVPVNGTAAIISGYVEHQDTVPKIIAVATKFFPEIINNMTVSGTQQGVVHVKVIEVSRTKLRNFGIDWAQFGPTTNEIFSGINGLLSTASTNPVQVSAPDRAFKFSAGGANAFYAVLNALRDDSLAKLLSEPNIVAISGRPAYVTVGGQIGYQVTSAQGVASAGWLPYGTRLDIVPIILGNGRMHIDVRATVSQVDLSNGVNGIPSLKSRESETGVELRSGQTLAIAGLIEQRTEAENYGLPWISEVPYLGVPFRSVHHLTNEVELVILLTPEIVDGMEPGQVPECLPGMNTTSPSDWELFFKGQIEVPNCCPTDGTCQTCAPGGTAAPSAPACEVVPPKDAQTQQNRSLPNQVASYQQPAEPGFIGPVGYDIVK